MGRPLPLDPLSIPITTQNELTTTTTPSNFNSNFTSNPPTSTRPLNELPFRIPGSSRSDVVILNSTPMMETDLGRRIRIQREVLGSQNGGEAMPMSLIRRRRSSSVSVGNDRQSIPPARTSPTRQPVEFIQPNSLQFNSSTNPFNPNSPNTTRTTSEQREAYERSTFSSPRSRRLSIGSSVISNLIRDQETESILTSARTALSSASAFAERLEQITRTLTSISSDVINRPGFSSQSPLPLPLLPISSTTEPSTLSTDSSTRAEENTTPFSNQLSPLRASLDSLRLASARIDRILIEERERAMNLAALINSSTSTLDAVVGSTTTPIEGVSMNTIRLLRETARDLRNEINALPLPSLPPSRFTSTPSIELPTIPAPSNPSLAIPAAFEAFNNSQFQGMPPLEETNQLARPVHSTVTPNSNEDITSNRRRVIYQIIVSRIPNPSSLPPTSSTTFTSNISTAANLNTSTPEVSAEAENLGNWKLDKNGDEIDLNEARNESRNTIRSRIERVGR